MNINGVYYILHILLQLSKCRTDTQSPMMRRIKINSRDRATNCYNFLTYRVSGSVYRDWIN